MLAILFPVMAHADPAPGDACSTINQVMHSGGPENSGNGYWMVCKAGLWTSIISSDANAMASTNTPTAANHIATKGYVDANAGTCDACDKIPVPFAMSSRLHIEYNTGVYVTSTIHLIQDITCDSEVTISGTGSPEYRTCEDNACSTVIANWTSAPGTIGLGNYIQMRLMPPATRNQTVTGTLRFANYFNISWSATTRNYYRVFATTAAYTGNLGGRAGADAACTTSRTAAGLPGTYKAWLSTNTTDAKDHVFQASIPYAKDSLNNDPAASSRRNHSAGFV